MLTWQFVGIMFVLSESAEALLPDEFGTVGGITGAVIFGVRVKTPIFGVRVKTPADAWLNPKNGESFYSDPKYPKNGESFYSDPKYLALVAMLLAAGTPALHASDSKSGYNFQTIVPPGYSEPEIFGLNNLGQIAGTLTVGTDQRAAFIFDSKSGELTLVPEFESLAAINDSGTSAGNLKPSGPDDPAICAIRDPDGSITTFSLPSIPNQYSDCFPRGISPHGLVTGFAQGPNGSIGFVHDPGRGSFEEFLPVTEGQIIAQGINSSGQLVGNVWPGTVDELFPGSLSQNYSFIRDPNGSFRYFTINGEIRAKARGINDQGQITGFFLGEDEQMFGFVIDRVGDSTFEDIKVPADRLLDQKPCGQDSKSQETEWMQFVAIVASAITNNGAVGGTCWDAWVLFDEEGNEVEVAEFMYAFIATPKS